MQANLPQFQYEYIHLKHQRFLYSCKNCRTLALQQSRDYHVHKKEQVKNQDGYIFRQRIMSLKVVQLQDTKISTKQTPRCILLRSQEFKFMKCYQEEWFSHLKERERKYQPRIRTDFKYKCPKARKSSINWLVNVLKTTKSKDQAQLLHQAYLLTDRVQSLLIDERRLLIASLLISSKRIEVYPIDIGYLTVTILRNQHTVDQISKTESEILFDLCFEGLDAPTSLDFLKYFILSLKYRLHTSFASTCNMKSYLRNLEKTAKEFCFYCLCDTYLSTIKASLIAACAIQWSISEIQWESHLQRDQFSLVIGQLWPQIFEKSFRGKCLAQLGELTKEMRERQMMQFNQI
ncbi:hypothetical protein FGO68_gene12564 [Halteria grandinella]|uniref:Cyclin N-terminal domain-containing protein n=1 Tax=Halteria grandinella TaxID=5974 RepID=A0A8J8T0I3_HALGN|nr:hypothetical protein FGO68_gene12564 [Halteria grandinella]